MLYVYIIIHLHIPVSLQLKNMINALFSSKIGGSKQFQRTDKCTFGWEAIDSLYQRELERAKQNLARMVPRLKETHVLRDAWTKLNVHPAKIMQVRFSIKFQAFNDVIV